jgi:hypothetical protein
LSGWAGGRVVAGMNIIAGVAGRRRGLRHGREGDHHRDRCEQHLHFLEFSKRLRKRQ